MPEPIESAPAATSPLPLHRVALRALLEGVVGGAGPALVVDLVGLLTGHIRGQKVPLIFLMGLAAFGTLCALLACAEQAALRVRPAGRPVALVGVGVLVPALAMAAAVWVAGALEGGAQGGYRALATLCSDAGREPGMYGALALSLTLPFVLVGGARTRTPPASRRIEVLAALLAGGIGFAAICVSEGDLALEMLPLWLGAPLSAVLARPWALRVEARLLAEHARRRDAAAA